MSRSICSKCHYPKKTCVCEAVTRISCQTKVYVMQHPSEVKAAKNTIRLAQLCLPSIEVIVGEEPVDFNKIKNLPLENTFLLYPNENAVEIENLAVKNIAKINLILLDGTWKKAYKILMKNPWLAKYETLSFASLPQNQYAIRKTKRSDSLSSLEAIAYSLEVLEGINTTPLYQVLHKMMLNFQQH
ncbi:tRNA-uridine aminocarboxypropyltransferase [Pseudoalteromonas denitrificans]|uniref:tRNA-uridine aminocarboxypropyltransferase n=1 Tax=Pseudoalteromonas denitrificans DSM 6059 TaxID=1123010 RepID=A0A1I1MHX8_9GAMM|nr:tRNA-uridine aminocarboxypropyltransferase [Pseudoalteromonas denitrificans]SFC85039.1 DTW domain-containing protein YfiP [Pseudoalteromonas denitrificans DSM 6059]